MSQTFSLSVHAVAYSFFFFLCVSNNIIYLFIYFASATELTCNQ